MKESGEMKDKKYANDSAKKKQSCIKGIVCDVNMCAYHGDKNSCCADKISVGTNSATCSAETVCATFRPKEY